MHAYILAEVKDGAMLKAPTAVAIINSGIEVADFDLIY